MRNLFLGILIALAVAAGWKWHKSYQANEEAREIAGLVRESSALVLKQINFFKDPHGETHAEVLESTESAIKRIGELVDALSAKDKVIDRPLLDHSIQYVKASQEAVRSIRQTVRAKVELAAVLVQIKGSVGALEDFVSDPHDSGKKFYSDVASYGTGPLLRRSNEASDAFNQAVDSTGKSLSKLISIRQHKPTKIPDDAYLSLEQVDGIKFSVR